jgi:hypothetical protein
LPWPRAFTRLTTSSRAGDRGSASLRGRCRCSRSFQSGSAALRWCCLVGGDLARTHHFEGSRGSVLWQERSVVMLHMDTGLDLERQWFEIKDDSGKLIAKSLDRSVRIVAMPYSTYLTTACS